MKLKKTFIAHSRGGGCYVVGVGGSDFSGIAKGNETAAMIIDCLKKDTTPEEITERLSKEYDAPMERLREDVDMVIGKLRSIGAIEEK